MFSNKDLNNLKKKKKFILSRSYSLFKFLEKNILRQTFRDSVAEKKNHKELQISLKKIEIVLQKY